MPEHITLKAIREKRLRFMKHSTLFAVITSMLFITAGCLLLTFWLSLILAAIIMLVSSFTLLAINRLYINKIVVARHQYIQSIFPIKAQLTKQQSQFILSDLAYLFGDNESTLDDKLRANNLSTHDMEKLNILYAYNFIDLTTIPPKSGEEH
ncbi:hypothetical protein [Paenibacillus agricola]|uniref:Uncharacterized protein n=1 Tax=Paenibacillus agricola TaxID=2716264 RepID=A0ABX0J259_9BACL|nr:hypothetical protein [Paenibacillus agricola]NHN29530.1 hypothetical protein [Paenibacillus agricola]